MAGIAVRLSLITLVLLFPLASPHGAAPAPGSAELLRYFADLRSLEARFEQLIIDPQGRGREHSRGTLLVLRPGRFRWAYEDPYEQLIVTDANTLWVYDPDLGQVTISELDTSVGNTPALLLSTDQRLEDLFLISEPEVDEELAWLLLEPREESETSFTRIFLGFVGAELRSMEIVDGFGQTVQIRFSDIRRNAVIDPALFEFTPPDGIDVIGEGPRAR